MDGLWPTPYYKVSLDRSDGDMTLTQSGRLHDGDEVSKTSAIKAQVLMDSVDSRWLCLHICNACTGVGEGSRPFKVRLPTFGIAR